MYRILTEDKNRESIFRILDSHVDGYTVTPAIGSWRGQREASLAIDLVNVEGFIVDDIASAIKATNEQESVLVLHFTAQSIFV
jgi:predicted Zn-dependent protease